ncbi:MAG: hypothetical protein IJT98_01370 [Prevotella sp.]|nr:hypothetical protein [Prevotella sp.]
MSFISTPLSYIEPTLCLVRDIEDRILMLDNLVELIVFTPRGSFEADPDFGFEYWNHEFSNVHYREFNINQTGQVSTGLHNDVTRKECEDSIRNSLATYEPMLKNVSVAIVLDSAEGKRGHSRKARSKYKLNVVVDGSIDDGLGTKRPYRKVVKFLVEPTVKRYQG